MRPCQVDNHQSIDGLTPHVTHGGLLRALEPYAVRITPYYLEIEGAMANVDRTDDLRRDLAALLNEMMRRRA